MGKYERLKSLNRLKKDFDAKLPKPLVTVVTHTFNINRRSRSIKWPSLNYNIIRQTLVRF